MSNIFGEEVKQFNEYFISKDGYIFEKDEKTLVPCFLRQNTKTNEKKLFANLRVKNFETKQIEEQTFAVDELIAKVWITNPQNLPLLNHRNGNLLDNRVVNLEWITKEALKQLEQMKKNARSSSIVDNPIDEVSAKKNSNDKENKEINDDKELTDSEKRLLKSLESLNDDDKLHDAAEGKENYMSPAYNILRVPIDKIRANDYNPNNVAASEMKLLYTSIYEDGYTMPIVCYYDKESDTYIIVDGFHRYQTMLDHKDIFDREQGYLPVSIIDKPIEDRIASTIRHNRAKGSHNVDLMASIVANLHKLGRTNRWIEQHLGCSTEELLRLQQFSGLAELFKDKKAFSKADMKAHHIVMKNKRAHVVEDLVE